MLIAKILFWFSFFCDEWNCGNCYLKTMLICLTYDVPSLLPCENLFEPFIVGVGGSEGAVVVTFHVNPEIERFVEPDAEHFRHHLLKFTLANNIFFPLSVKSYYSVCHKWPTLVECHLAPTKYLPNSNCWLRHQLWNCVITLNDRKQSTLTCLIWFLIAS